MLIVMPCAWLLCSGDKGRGKVLRWEREGPGVLIVVVVWNAGSQRSPGVYLGLFQPEMCSRVEGELRASYSLEQQHCLMSPEQGQVAAVST